MKRLIAASILMLAAQSASAMTGFGADAAEAQRTLEASFDENIRAQDLETWMKTLARRPHHLGSAAGKDNATYIAKLLGEWGFEVSIEEYEVLLPVPAKRRLAMLEPTLFEAALEERTLAEDPSTAIRDDLLPPYNAFSVDGDVTAPLVFVNYGVPEDYDELERFGIDVTGKIVIAKYGKSWRGIKPKLAAEKGAIGTIIYSDPADDGYAKGDVYPAGPFKNDSGVQRGSVMDMPLYPGDVLTPGRGATKRARRLARSEAATITKVPVLPISYSDALPLLKALGGPVAPDGWRGALPITYHLGPGPAKVNLALEFDWRMVTAYNVIARINGSEFPDQWIIRGNHHDGWNHGAADPVSGLVALLAEARAVAGLAAAGEPPKRTLVYAAWDAEEPGLIGSTEWAEANAKALKEHAVAYLNTDGNSRGFVAIGGSHSLERFFNEVIADVQDPQTGASLADRARANILVTGTDEQKQDLEARGDLRIAPLGSGSDFTPFLQHLGIASAHTGFRGEAADGSYHTLYDTVEHYLQFRDPGLAYGAALAKLNGRATLRLANAAILPFEFTGFVDNVASYVKEIEKLAADLRLETAKTNTMIDDGTFALALDPTKDLGPPAKKADVPFFNLAPLKNAVDDLTRAAAAFQAALANAQPEEIDNPNLLNTLIFTTERLMTREEGLPGRPWYKHYIYAPGFYTGYGVKTLPGHRSPRIRHRGETRAGHHGRARSGDAAPG
jgi:N-acetylated-alpha-linked acidic dipeptidase